MLPTTLRFNFRSKFLVSLLGLAILTYISTCFYLYAHQRQLILRPTSQLSTFPDDSRFNIPYQSIKVPVAGQYLHGWWIPAPLEHEKLNPLPGEPVRIVKAPKTVLYLYGAGGNKGYYNCVTRVEGLRNLGFSVMVIDYRGFGESKGNSPNEKQMYADSEAAWNYLIKRNILPQDILIYGESLGGAVAINLAVNHPEASRLIVQSSFTSMAEVVKHRDWLWLFPIDLMLTEKFDSISKIRSLKMPVLFIHGTGDSVVPSYMSERLYKAAPGNKQLLLVPGAEHYRIYQPGDKSYLRAIEKFLIPPNPP